VVDNDHSARHQLADARPLTGGDDCRLPGAQHLRGARELDLQFAVENVPHLLLVVRVGVHARVRGNGVEANVRCAE
jgi:hypothetical protein